MRCDDPKKRKCDDCGAVVDTWCEYAGGDVCLTCEPNELNGPPSPTARRRVLSLCADFGKVSVYGNGKVNPQVDEHDAAKRILLFPEMFAVCEYVLDMLRQQFPDGKGGTETMAQKLAAAGGACAERMVSDVIAKVKDRALA